MRRAAPLVVLALALGGCGSEAGDVFLLERSGPGPGQDLTLRLTQDGRVSCNGGGLVDLRSQDLFDARLALRDLQGKVRNRDEEGPADLGLRIAPGPNGVQAYEVRTESGTVAWGDTSVGKPPVFDALAALAKRIAEGPCGLAR